MSRPATAIPHGPNAANADEINATMWKPHRRRQLPIDNGIEVIRVIPGDRDIRSL